MIVDSKTARRNPTLHKDYLNHRQFANMTQEFDFIVVGGKLYVPEDKIAVRGSASSSSDIATNPSREEKPH